MAQNCDHMRECGGSCFQSFCFMCRTVSDVLAFILNVEVIKVAQTMSSMHPEHSNIALSIMPRHPENRNVANGILSYGGSTT